MSFLGLAFPFILKLAQSFGLGALEKWLEYLKASAESAAVERVAEINLMVKQVETAIEEGKARERYVTKLTDKIWFQFIVGIVFLSIGAYTSMVFIDSILQEAIQWDYNVQKVPPPFDTLLLWFWSLITLKFTFFRGK